MNKIILVILDVILILLVMFVIFLVGYTLPEVLKDSWEGWKKLFKGK